MYQDFSIWLTDLEAYKIGCMMGFFMGMLSYFIITAIVEYAVDLFHRKRKDK